jgi:3,4-dihydroxy 2-butanone 4-phosphate synthase
MEESMQWASRIATFLCLFAQGISVAVIGCATARAVNPLKGFEMAISRIEDAIAAIGRGEIVVVVDDRDRENEGDLFVASELITPEAIAFMMNHARGLICVPMEGERLDELDIPLMVPNNTEMLKTAFTVSVDYIPETTTGISAADRAATVRALVTKETRPEDFARPGHIFPLRAHPEGVLGRPGHTEAAIDLAKLAGLSPSGVICEVANDDGTMARLPELEVFAERHSLHLITIEDLIAFRRREAVVSVKAA